MYDSPKINITTEDKRLEYIARYQKLLEDGVITQEKFDAKKETNTWIIVKNIISSFDP